MVLEQSDGSFRVVVGSTNLTDDGLCRQAETFTWFDIGPSKYPGTLLEDLRDLLGSVAKDLGSSRWSTAGRGLHQALSSCKARSDKKPFPRMLSSYKGSILRQYLAGLGNEQLLEMRLVSPFFEEDKAYDKSVLAGLVKTVRGRGCEHVRLYLPGNLSEGGKASVSAPRRIFQGLAKDGVAFHVVPSGWAIKQVGEVPRKLHAKLILAVTGARGKPRKVHVLVGSPNLSKCALGEAVGGAAETMNLSAARDDLNVEAAVHLYLPFEGKSSVEDLLPDVKAVTFESLLFAGEEPEPAKRSPIYVVDAVYDVRRKELRVELQWKLLPESFVLRCGAEEVLRGKPKRHPVELRVKKDLGEATELTLQIPGKGPLSFPIRFMNEEELPPGSTAPTLDLMGALEYLSGQQPFPARSDDEPQQKESGKKAGKKRGKAKQGAASKTLAVKLDLFFRAVEGLRARLARPAMTEAAFREVVDGWAGLSKLVQMIREHRRNGQAREPEVYFWLAQLKRMLGRLEFPDDDPVPPAFKRRLLGRVEDRVAMEMKAIEKGAGTTLRRQYVAVRGCLLGA
jgi:hypothetical protein